MLDKQQIEAIRAPDALSEWTNAPGDRRALLAYVDALVAAAGKIEWEFTACRYMSGFAEAVGPTNTQDIDCKLADLRALLEKGR